MRFADQIARHGLDWSMAEIVDEIAAARLIVADNVAEYFFESDRDDWPLATSFPALVPPFKTQFIEWKYPRYRMFQGERQEIPRGVDMSGGCFVRAYENITDEDRRCASEMISHLKPEQRGVDADARWMLTFHPIIGARGRAISYPWELTIAVSEHGEFIGCWDIVSKSRPPFFGDHMPKDSKSEECLPALLTISLMNCSNIRAIPVTPPSALSRAHRKRHGHLLRSYHILEIDGLRAAAREQNGGQEMGMRQAMAICRGHFKDYRKSGLFGKIRGVFWWDAFARGDRNLGSSLKDYAVKP